MAPITRSRRGILLQGFKVAITESFGPDWTARDVSRWVTLHGGAFSNAVDEGVTHLLATHEQLRQRHPEVKKALEFKDTHIVTQDWLEDTLHKNKLQDEYDYSLREVFKQEDARKKREEHIRKAVELGERFVDTTLYHIYRDETYFSYDVTIARGEEEAGAVGQRYILYIWESNAKPHLYHFAAKFYKKSGYSWPAFYRPRDVPGILSRSRDDFKHFFLKKTGIRWEERITKQGTAPADKFQYQPPTGGKPVGIIEEIESEDDTKPASVFKKSSRPSGSGPKPAPVVYNDSKNDKAHVASGYSEYKSRAGTKRGLGSQSIPPPPPKKQKTATGGSTAEKAAISNLAELVRKHREKQGVESRKLQEVSIADKDGPEDDSEDEPLSRRWRSRRNRPN
ncbi:hypothetical protein GGR52DRAFT_11311 [Hypoxylon sp. FL1284]|nr:hypothetical protein GGR52DRAFT_11311 [Hypoxylon sp. FL1284]